MGIVSGSAGKPGERSRNNKYVVLSPVKLVRTQLLNGRGQTVQLVPQTSHSLSVCHAGTQIRPTFVTTVTPVPSGLPEHPGGCDFLTHVPETGATGGSVNAPPSVLHPHASPMTPSSFPQQVPAQSFPLATAQQLIDRMYPVRPGPPIVIPLGQHQTNQFDCKTIPAPSTIQHFVSLADGYSTIPVTNIHSPPRLALLANASDRSSTIRRPCNCTRSMCLKLYCDCFANGEFCQNCNCANCHNNASHENDRGRAIKGILDRNPRAFHPKVGKNPQMEKKHYKGCNCKKSACLKNYCECYEGKVTCGLRCKCTGCCNTDPRRHHVRKQSATSLPSSPDVPETSANYGGDLLGESQISAPPLHDVTNEGRHYAIKNPQSTSVRSRLKMRNNAQKQSMSMSVEEAFADFNSENPWCLIRDDIVLAFAQCTLAEVKAAEDAHLEATVSGAQSDPMSAPGQAHSLDPVVIERTVILEFGRCLQQLLRTANEVREANLKAAQKYVSDTVKPNRLKSDSHCPPPSHENPPLSVLGDRRYSDQNVMPPPSSQLNSDHGLPAHDGSSDRLTIKQSFQTKDTVGQLPVGGSHLSASRHPFLPNNAVNDLAGTYSNGTTIFSNNTSGCNYGGFVQDCQNPGGPAGGGCDPHDGFVIYPTDSTGPIGSAISLQSAERSVVTVTSISEYRSCEPQL